jgi:hypothetical protein
MSHSLAYLAFVTLLLGACKREPEAATRPDARTPAATTPAAKNARRAQGKCPNWVPGAKTSVSEPEGAVELLIMAGAEPAAVAIRERARYLAEGKSKGGDATGQCPVLREARLEASDVDGGARVLLRPTDALPLDKLRAEVRARLARAVE